MHLPPLDEGVVFPGGHEAVQEVTERHGYNHSIRRRSILQHVPAYIVYVSHQEDAAVHPDAAVVVQTRTAEEIGAVRAHVDPVQCVLVKCVRQPRGDVLGRVVGGCGIAVENADGPVGPADADPADHVAPTPCWHVADAAVPEGPDVLLGCDGLVVEKRAEDLIVGFFVVMVIFDGRQFILVFGWDLNVHLVTVIMLGAP